VETNPSTNKVVQLMSNVTYLNNIIPALGTPPVEFAKWKDDILHDIGKMKDINPIVDALFCSILLSRKDDDQYSKPSSPILTAGNDTHVLNVLNHYQNFHNNSFTNNSSTFIYDNNNNSAYNASSHSGRTLLYFYSILKNT